MEGHCSTGQSPQWAVVPMEEEVNTEFELKIVTITSDNNGHLEGVCFD